MSQHYPTLFTPIDIGQKRAKNRVWMTAHATQLVKDHNFSPEHIAYYAERARGGAALITMEAMAVHPTTQPYAGKVFAFNERVVPSYRRLAEAVHEHDCLLVAQPWHRGRETSSIVSRLPVWAPSSVPSAVYREIPHVMTKQEIDEIVDGYRRAAHYAALGGLDGLEIHGIAHGYLLGQFLSPATNHRRDEYGGTDKNRLRIVLDVINATREELGREFIVGIRINGDDGEVERGLRVEDWARIARTITATGLIDYVSVSQGTYHDRMLIYGAAPVPPGYQIAATAKIKEAIPGTPVVAVGRITSPELAERIVREGKADIVGMARTLIADPEWPQKASEDREADIRPCVGANWCLVAITNSPLACIHNPAVGRERTLGVGTAGRARTRRRVAVVGAGPAGLRVALTAAERGHSVEVFDQQEEAGGQIRAIAKVAAYREWGSIADWLVTQSHKVGVTLRLGETATAELLNSSDFEAVVLATGARPLRHGWSADHPSRWGDAAVPGIENWWVMTAAEALAEAEAGQSVLVYDTLGDRQGVVVAEYMADRHHDVEFVTPLPQVAPELSASRDQEAVYRRLRGKGVMFTTGCELVAVVDDTATLRDVYTDADAVREPVDAVVLVVGSEARDELAGQIDGRELHMIGDCLAPRRIFNAIWEGELVGRAL